MTARLRRTNYKSGSMYPKALIREKLHRLQLDIFPQQDVTSGEKSLINTVLASSTAPISGPLGPCGNSISAVPGSPVSPSPCSSSYSSSPVLNSINPWHPRPDSASSMKSEDSFLSSLNSPLPWLPQGSPESAGWRSTSSSSFPTLCDSPVMRGECFTPSVSNCKNGSPCFIENFGENTFKLFDDEANWDIIAMNLQNLVQLVEDTE